MNYIGLHHAIYKVLESRLQLKRADITRLATYYHGRTSHTPLLEDGSNFYFQVMVEIREGAFLLSIPSFIKAGFGLGKRNMRFGAFNREGCIICWQKKEK